jgi:integrase
MGSIYRKTERVTDNATGEPALDPSTGKPRRIDVGPYWIKYYRNGRPFRESTGTLDRTEARRKLKRREGEVADGRFRGLAVERTKFDDLAEDLKTSYEMNHDKQSDSGRLTAAQRLSEALEHLNGMFKTLRATDITSDKVQKYINRRQQQGAANGTINRELGMLKRMFSLAMEHTPPKVVQAPYIPHLRERVRSGFFEHEDFLALRGALPDYAQVPVTLAYYSGMRMGEVFSLKWEQINWKEGKLSLKPQDTKTKESRVLYITSDLYRVLEAWKVRTDEQAPNILSICHRSGKRLQSIRSAWRRGCQHVGLGKMIENEQKGRKVWQGKIPHDFRRTAVRNMIRAGVPQAVAMAISGHKTQSVFNRYNIVDEADLKAAADRLSGYFLKETGTISGTVAELEQHASVPDEREGVEA